MAGAVEAHPLRDRRCSSPRRRPRRFTIRIGCPGATRTRDPRPRKAALCSTELRDISPEVRPGGFEPPTALQSGAHDGYKPSALPIELWAQSHDREIGQGGWIRTNG